MKLSKQQINYLIIGSMSVVSLFLIYKMVFPFYSAKYKDKIKEEAKAEFQKELAEKGNAANQKPQTVVQSQLEDELQ